MPICCGLDLVLLSFPSGSGLLVAPRFLDAGDDDEEAPLVTPGGMIGGWGGARLLEPSGGTPGGDIVHRLVFTYSPLL